jgi:hypothetical protein
LGGRAWIMFDVPAWPFVFYSRFFSSISLQFAPLELSKSFGKSTPALCL